MEDTVEAALPDQTRWLPHWMKSLKTKSLQQLVTKMNYDGPVELFSCFACIFGDSALEGLAPQQLAQAASRIQQVRASTRRLHGWEGNPVLIVRQALAL